LLNSLFGGGGSFGIFILNGSAPVIENNVFYLGIAGSGGNGGESLGNDGSHGSDGIVVSVGY
jgi:hypothetical protein